MERPDVTSPAYARWAIRDDWFRQQQEGSFWRWLERQPLLFVHNLLDGLDAHIVAALSRCDYDFCGTAADYWEHAQACYSHRQEVADLIGSLVIKNYEGLRQVTIRLEAKEIGALLGCQLA